MEYGIRSVSMDDICRHMGISKKTLYQYVDSKTDLVEKMMQYMLEVNECTHSFFEGKGLNAIDILIEVSKIVSENLRAFKPQHRFDLEKYYPEIFNDFVKQKNLQIYRALIDNINQGIAEGLYREDLNSEVIAGLYIKKMEQIHDKEFFRDFNFTLEQIFVVMFESHIRGIANESGIQYLEQRKEKLNLKID